MGFLHRETTALPFVDDQRPRPSVTVDVVVFGLRDGVLHVLLGRRTKAPFEGHWALPGGFVSLDEGLDDAAARVIREKAADTPTPFLEQLYTFGAPDRDRRTRVITVTYYALVPPQIAAEAADGLRWFAVPDGLPDALAFDHADILRVGVDRLRGKLDYTSVAYRLLGERFTIAEARQAHGAVLGSEMDPGNFRRGFNRKLEDGIIEETGKSVPTRRRPAMTYRLAKS